MDDEERKEIGNEVNILRQHHSHRREPVQTNDVELIERILTTLSVDSPREEH